MSAIPGITSPSLLYSSPKQANTAPRPNSFGKRGTLVDIVLRWGLGHDAEPTALFPLFKHPPVGFLNLHQGLLLETLFLVLRPIGGLDWWLGDGGDSHSPSTTN